MEGAKQFLKDKGIMSRISFQDLAEHQFELINSKADKISDGNGVIEGVKFLVNDGGENKTFFTGSPELIQKLSELEEHTVVKVQMVKRNTQKGVRSGYSVTVVSLPDGSLAPVREMNQNGTMKPKPKAVEEESQEKKDETPIINLDDDEIDPEEIPF